MYVITNMCFKTNIYAICYNKYIFAITNICVIKEMFVITNICAITNICEIANISDVLHQIFML